MSCCHYALRFRHKLHKSHAYALPARTAACSHFLWQRRSCAAGTGTRVTCAARAPPGAAGSTAAEDGARLRSGLAWRPARGEVEAVTRRRRPARVPGSSAGAAPAYAAPGGRAALGPPAAAAAARPAQRPAARGALPIRPARPHRLSGALARSPAARTGSTAAGRAPPLCDTHPIARRRSRRPPIRPGRRRRRLLGAGFLRVRWRPSVGSGPDVDPL